MLELIVKGLILWVYDMILECVGFIGNLLLEVFSMDTSYFVSHVPVVLEMQKILIAWAGRSCSAILRFRRCAP